MRTWPLLVLVVLMVWAVQSMDAAETDKEEGKEKDDDKASKDKLGLLDTIKKAGKDVLKAAARKVKELVSKMGTKIKNLIGNKDKDKSD